jgi:hypothetical protein
MLESHAFEGDVLWSRRIHQPLQTWVVAAGLGLLVSGLIHGLLPSLTVDRPPHGFGLL